jgi:hypothetical protein
MAEISASKGRDAVARIEGAGGQPGGLARPQVSPEPPAGGRRRREGGEERDEFHIEIGEEARRSLRERQAEEEPEAAAEAEVAAETKEESKHGAILDVVV